MDGWIKKMWYLNTVGFYSATKKNENLLFADKCVELDNYVKLARFRNSKATHFLSYVEYRTNTKTAML
jgi:hypothetical protein